MVWNRTARIAAAVLALSSLAAGAWDYGSVRLLTQTAFLPEGTPVWVERRVDQGSNGPEYRWAIRSAAPGGATHLWADLQTEPVRLAATPAGLQYLAPAGDRMAAWLIARPGTPPRLLPPEGNLTRAAISPDGTLLAWLALDRTDIRDVREFRASAWVQPISGGPARRLTDPVLDPSELAWHPRSTHLAVHAAKGAVKRTALVEIDIARAKQKRLTQDDGADSQPLYSPEGDFIAFVRAGARGMPRGAAAVFTLERRSGKVRSLGSTPNAGPVLLGWAPGNGPVYAADRIGVSQGIYSFPPKGKPSLLYQPETGVIHNEAFFAGSGNRGRFAFVRESPGDPPEVFSWNPESGDPTRLSSANRHLPEVHACRTTVIRWKSNDGEEIEGLLSQPAEPSAPAPLAVLLHGGPAGVFSAGFDGGDPMFPVASLCAAGYRVLRPNPRGSNGYGAEFRGQLYGDLGGKDAEDVIAGVQTLRNGGAAPDRVVAAGWSYGGYLALYLAARHALFSRIAAGAAMTDLAALHRDSILPGLVERYLGGSPRGREERYAARSPIRHLDTFAANVLLLHGESDLQVPASQATRFATALEEKGLPVRLEIIPGMAHEPETAAELQAVTNLLAEWLELQPNPGPAH